MGRNTQDQEKDREPARVAMPERPTKLEAVVRTFFLLGKKEERKIKDEKCQEGHRLCKKVLIQIQSKVKCDIILSK